MNILITGVHGFVGFNLVKLLNGQNNIYGLDIIAPYKEGVLQTFAWEDLNNYILPEVDAIIHLAGKAHDTKNHADTKVYFDVNLGLTEKIYDYFLHSSASIFMFFSSVKAAADFVEGAQLTEDVIPSPKGPYGESKIAAENYILKKIPDNKSVYILRPCMIHGPGNKGNLNLLYNVVKKGIPWPLGAFENRRSFTSIDNLSFVINKMLINNIESGIYNIGDDEPLSTNELIQIMSSEMGRPARILKIKCEFMSFIAKIGSILHLPLNSERLNKLTENYVVSNSKLKFALEIDKMPVSAKEGLMKTIRSFENK